MRNRHRMIAKTTPPWYCEILMIAPIIDLPNTHARHSNNRKPISRAKMLQKAKSWEEPTTSLARAANGVATP